MSDTDTGTDTGTDEAAGFRSATVASEARVVDREGVGRRHQRPGPARALVRRSGRRARFAHQHAHETTSSLLAVRRRLPRVSATDTPGTHGWTDVRAPRHAVASARSHRRVDVRFSGRVSRFAPRNDVALPTVRSVFARASASFAAANDREPAVVSPTEPRPANASVLAVPVGTVSREGSREGSIVSSVVT